jgi:curved DNA-binding protein CbpA
MTTKNHYAVLGILMNAEDIVIRAAYRALAQHYHPDKYHGDMAEATRRMVEINEAYAVLSDPEKRKIYDSSQHDKSGKASGSYEDDFSQGDDSGSETNDYLDADWNFACSIYADLRQIDSRHKKISHALADTYRIYMLETKQFDNRWAIAASMETRFLATYFGGNPKLHEFARDLIMSGRRDASLALNRMVRVVGDKDPDTLIDQFRNNRGILPTEVGRLLVRV